jgi:deoxycytidylate deaminase
MNAYDHKLFALARAAARTSTHNKAHIGAVIVCGKDILSVGVNGMKSHPLQAKYNRLRFEDERANHLMHAELDALVKAKAMKANPAVYIYRELRHGGTGMSRPCVGCLRALIDHGVTRMFYTTEQGFAYEEIS